METIYRKVAVSERKPTKGGTYLSNEGEVFYSSAYKEFQHNYDPHVMYPDWWLEPIEPTINPDNTATIQTLEAEKAELLEALAKLCDLKHIKDLDGKTPYYLEQQPLAWTKAISIIQKHRT